MHSYELDGRGRVAIVLAAASVLLVWLSHVMLRYLGIEPRWWLSLPSFGGIYGVLLWLYDHYLWRWGVLGTVEACQSAESGWAMDWRGALLVSSRTESDTLRVRSPHQAKVVQIGDQARGHPISF